MTENDIAISVLPRTGLDTIEQRLEMGESILDVIGEQGKLIQLSSIGSITAELSNTDLIVVFKIRGRTKTVTLRFSDSIAQLNALEAARSRMKGKTQLVDSTRSKLSHIMTPLNFVIFFGTLLTMSHLYFESDPFEAEKNRIKFEEYRQQNERHRTASPGRPSTQPLAPRYEPPHKLSNNPIVDKCLKFGYMVLGSLAMILSNLGYTTVISILMFLTAISVFFLFSRVLHPPRIRVLTTM